jgi:hypothetical protein
MFGKLLFKNNFPVQNRIDNDKTVIIKQTRTMTICFCGEILALQNISADRFCRLGQQKITRNFYANTE